MAGKTISLTIPELCAFVGDVTDTEAYILVNSAESMRLIVTLHGPLGPYTPPIDEHYDSYSHTSFPEETTASNDQLVDSTHLSQCTTDDSASVPDDGADTSAPSSIDTPENDTTQVPLDVHIPCAPVTIITHTEPGDSTLDIPLPNVPHDYDDSGNISRSSSGHSSMHTASVEDLAQSMNTQLQFARQINAGPNTIPIQGLHPDNYYTVILEAYFDHLNTQVFHTFETLGFWTRGGHELGKMIIVSCDFPEMDTSNSLWNNIQVENPNFVLHLGDQVYADEIFESLAKRPKDMQTKAAYAAYNDLYRRVFLRWTQLLTQSSHILILDDHDITNGAAISSYKRGTVRSRIANIAKSVYDNHNPIPTIQVPHYDRDCYVQNGYLAESRMGVRWKKLNDDTLLMIVPRYFSNGVGIYEDFFDTLREVMYREGEYNAENTTSQSFLSTADGKVLFESTDHPRKIRKLLIGFTSAPVPRPSGAAVAAYRSVFGTDGLWENVDVQRLYETILQLIISRNGQIQVILVGGDLHLGLHATVSDGCHQFEVCVSSPISNQPTDCERLYANGLRNLNTIGNLRFDVHLSSAMRNYLSLDLDTFIPRMVFSKQRFPKNKVQALKSVMRML